MDKIFLHVQCKHQAGPGIQEDQSRGDAGRQQSEPAPRGGSEERELPPLRHEQEEGRGTVDHRPHAQRTYKHQEGPRELQQVVFMHGPDRVAYQIHHVRDNQHTEPGVFILSGDVPAGLGQDIDIQQKKRGLEHAEGKQDVLVHTVFPPSVIHSRGNVIHSNYNKSLKKFQHCRQGFGSKREPKL